MWWPSPRAGNTPPYIPRHGGRASGSGCSFFMPLMATGSIPAGSPKWSHDREKALQTSILTAFCAGGLGKWSNGRMEAAHNRNLRTLSDHAGAARNGAKGWPGACTAEPSTATAWRRRERLRRRERTFRQAAAVGSNAGDRGRRGHRRSGRQGRRADETGWPCEAPRLMMGAGNADNEH